jgi:hypothetical protein
MDCANDFTECKESKQCAPAKHHFDECVERVTGATDEHDKKHPGEDCVEECKFVPKYDRVLN